MFKRNPLLTPGKPTLVGSASHNSLLLRWRVLGNRSKVTHHTLTYRTVSDTESTGQWLLLETEDSEPKCKVEHLAPETSYQFRVAVNTKDGSSPQSEMSDVITTTGVPVPATPTNIRLVDQPTHNNMKLTWDIEDNSNYVESYTLYYYTEGDKQWTDKIVHDNPISVSGLSPDTTYVFTVVAHSSSGSSEPSAYSEPFSTARNSNMSNVACGSTPPQKSKRGSLIQFWQDRDRDKQASTTKYPLPKQTHVATKPTYTSASKDTDAKRHSLLLKTKHTEPTNDLEPSFQFRDAADTVNGSSSQRETSGVEDPVPATPTAIRLVDQPTHNSMNLTWDIKDDSNYVQSYTLFYKTTEDKDWDNEIVCADNTVTVLDLKADTKYVYSVIAYSSSGYGQHSECSEPFSTAKDIKAAHGKMPPKPEKPVQAGPATDNSLSIAWQVLGDTTPVTHYTVTYRTIDKNIKATGRWMMQETDDAYPKCTVECLDPETSYQFRVATNTNDGLSPPSEMSDAITTTAISQFVAPTAARDPTHPTKPKNPNFENLRASVHALINIKELPIAGETNATHGPTLPVRPKRIAPVVPTMVKTPLLSPGTPQLAKQTHDTLTVIWDVHEEGAAAITHYTLSYTEDAEVDVCKKVNVGACNEFTICSLKHGTGYLFKVVAHTLNDWSPPSEVGGPFKTAVHRTPEQIFREEILRNSKPVKSDKAMQLYQLPFLMRKRHDQENIQKLDFGVPKVRHTPVEKVILVVGATGSGKSTLINGLINYVLGVEWDDNYRFRLVEESGLFAAQHMSQTQGITVYTLHHQDELKIPYTLTIIDTPGFGDTAGIERDKKITATITSLFENPDYGIDHIDAVGFVTQASLPRLTHTQQYIFESILSLFGKDIASNIFLLITFCDGQKPSVLASIDQAKFPFHSSFKFNNSALFAVNKSENVRFDQMFWEMGVLSMEKFLHTLASIEGKSLYLTKEVLEKRHQVEVYVAGIQEDIQKGLHTLEQYKTELDVVKKHQGDIERNKNFTYTVDEHTSVHEDLKPGEHVTNCLQCNRTCHYPCMIPNDDGKARCWAMDGSGNCRICDARCFWNLHRNVPYRIVVKIEKKRKTADDLKKRYEEASGEKMNAEKLSEKILDDFNELEMKVIYMTDEVRKGITKLNEIALRPNPLSTVNYLELMIKSEKAEAKPGWKARIDQLTLVKAQAETLSKLAKDGYDPFAEYKKMLKMTKSNNKPALKALAINIRQKCGFSGKNIKQFLGIK